MPGSSWAWDVVTMIGGMSSDNGFLDRRLG